MSNLWKRVLSVLLAVVMVIAGLPSMGTREVTAAYNQEFDPTLEYFNVKASTYPVGQVSHEWIKWVISDDQNAVFDTSKPRQAEGAINFWNNPNARYDASRYSWYVDLTAEIPNLITLLEAGHKLYYGLLKEGGSDASGYTDHYPNTIKDYDGVPSIEFKNDPSYRSGGIGGEPRDDIGYGHKGFSIFSGKEGGLHIQKIAVELHAVNNWQDLNATYYTQAYWEPNLYEDDPYWVWGVGDGSEYIEEATATFKIMNKDKKFNVSKRAYKGSMDGNVVTSSKDGVKTVFEADANFVGTEVEEKLVYTDGAHTDGHAYSTKVFDQPVVNCDEAIQAGKTKNNPPSVSATFWRSGLTPDMNVDPGWADTSSEEHYDRPAQAVVENDNETKAKLYGRTTQAFGASAAGTETVKREYTVSWNWAPDNSSATVTFTNSADSHSPYTVTFNSSEFTTEDNGNGTLTYVATAWFGGTAFVGRSTPVDMTPNYQNPVWLWNPAGYNASNDIYTATLTLDEYKGTTATGNKVTVTPAATYVTSSANPPASGYTYVKGSDQKTTMNAYAPYDGEAYTTSPTYTKVFNAPTWDWPNLQTAKATFKDSQNSSESYTREAAGSKVEYVKAPERKADGSYILTKKATVTFLKNDFVSPNKEFTVTPTITVIPPPVVTGEPSPTPIPSSSEVLTDNWIWDAYSETDDNITAIATIGEFIDDYSTTEPVYFTDIADADTANKAKNKETANKTKNTVTGSNDRHVYFQGQVVYNGKTFTSGEREFKLEKTEWTGFTSCVFTFKEVGSYAKGTPETITITGTTPVSLGLEYETDGNGNRIGTMKQTWKSTATLGGCQFTSTKEEAGIAIDDMALWAYTNYLKPTEPSDKGYTASVSVKGTDGISEVDSAAGLPVTATKNADSETILTPKEAGQVVKKEDGKLYFHSNVTGKDYPAISATVKAPTWRWNDNNSKAWATFEQEWNSWKTDEIEATMKDSARVEDKANKRYVWTRTATVIFCGNEFTSEYQLWVPIKENDEEDDPSPSTSDKSGWTWGAYRPNDDNYTATVHIEKVWYKNDVLDKTEKKDLSDTDTRSPKSKDESTVYFQGSVEFDGFTLTSSERTFTVESKKVWDESDYTSCKFTFNEDASSVLNDKIERVATYPKGTAGEITYGALEDDDQNLGKLMRDANAVVTFGGVNFSDKTKQRNIEPDGYDVEWTWSEYNKKNDKYTATYKITVRNTGKSVNGNGTPVDASAVAPDQKETTLTASIPVTDPFYSKIDEKDRTSTRTVRAPTWNWTSDNSSATATFVENWDKGKTLDPFNGNMSDSGRVHKNNRYVWTRTAEVTFCGNKFYSKYELSMPDNENKTSDTSDAGWKWSDYRQNDDNFTATARITKVTIQNGVAGTPETITLDDTDTRSPKSTGGNNGTVYFQGEVTYDGVTFTSNERSFTISLPVTWDTSQYTWCDFTFKEQGGLNDSIVRRAASPKSVAGEITYGPEVEDDYDRAMLMRTVDAEVTFGGQLFTAETIQRNIKPSAYLAEWIWHEYVDASKTNGDKYTATCIVKKKGRETLESEVERSLIDPVEMVKNSDETTTLSASYTSQAADNKTFYAPTQTVSAPVWKWSADRKSATATFTEQWGPNKTIVFSGAQVTYTDLPVEHDTVNHVYRLTRVAKITFCRNEFTSDCAVEWGDGESFELSSNSGWTWEKYDQAKDNITATAHLVEKIIQNGKVLEEKKYDIADEDTILTAKSQGSEGNETVYFQGEVEINGMTIRSSERVFKCTGHDWTANTYEKCTFKMVENGGLNEKVDRVAPDSKDSSLQLGDYIPDGSKFKRKADAFVFFGKCKFIADDWQTDIEYKVDWKWSKYIAKDDKYTATYTISLPATGETLETDTVDAEAVKNPTTEVTTLTATAVSKKYGTFKDTRTVNAPKWDWKSDKSYKEAGATFVETWTDGETLPEFAANVSADSAPVLNQALSLYEISRTATVTFCHNQFTSEFGLDWKVDDGPSTGSGTDFGWTWSKYDQAADNFTATAHVTPYIIAAGVRVDEPIVDIDDKDTVLKDKSKDNGTVYFQGEVEYKGFTLRSNERSFVKDKHVWEPNDYSTCTFTFTETTPNADFTESYDRVAPTSTGSSVTYGAYEPSKKYPDKFQRTAEAYVYFGKCKFDADGLHDNIGYIVDWKWSDYQPVPDKYTATYTIMLPSSKEVLETATVDVAAAKDPTSQKTTLTATAVSAKYGVFSDQRTVEAPKWTWVNHADGRVYASFKETWEGGKTIEINATVTKGTEYLPVPDGREMYYLTHTADAAFCKNPFDDKDEEEKPPTYDKIVTPTPTPVGFVPTVTPTPKPGEPTPLPEEQKSIITWSWDDYKETLNGRDGSGNAKGSFNQATAMLHDDQRGFFVKSYKADGKKTGKGGITITSPTTPINPATITYTAEVEHTTSTGEKKKLQDALNFGLPTWAWQGNTAATATFKESNGKEFGKTPTTEVSIYTEDVTHEPSLETTTYTANAYFGERHYQTSKVVNTDYVVYLRWPSSWKHNGKNGPFDVYCYVHDDQGHNNGTTKVNGKDVKGELMSMVTEKTTRFFNYPLAKGDLVDPVVEFYDPSGNRLETPDVQFMENGKATDIKELRMTETGDWIYYEATIETTATNNTWKKYIPEVNAHSLTVLESGIIGLNFKYELPERYAGSGGSLTFTVPTLSANGEQPTRYSFNNADRQRDGRFVFRRNVRAYRMGDKIHAVFNYGSNGTVLDDFSVEDYLTEMIGRADQGVQRFVALRNVLCALNDYGSYSQTGLNGTAPYQAIKKIYNTPALPSKTEAISKLGNYKAKILRNDLGEDVTFDYKLQCWEDIRINVYIKAKQAASAKAEKIAQDDPETGGTFDPLVIQPVYYTSSGEYRVTLKGIPLDALEKSVTVRLNLDGKIIEFKVCALSAPYAQFTQGTYDAPEKAEALKQALGIINVWRELYKFFNSKDPM